MLALKYTPELIGLGLPSASLLLRPSQIFVASAGSKAMPRALANAGPGSVNDVPPLVV